MDIPFVDGSQNIIRLAEAHYGQILFRVELPQLALISNFLTSGECDQIIQLARDRLIVSQVVGKESADAFISPNRSSYDVSFSLGENEFIAQIDERIAKLCNWSIFKSTGLQVIRYRPGEFFAPHFDYISPNLLTQNGGQQRVATLMVYLNDVESGGRTAFPDAGITITPQRGAGLFFSYKHARRASMTRHGGDAPSSGEKWVAVKWLTI